MVRSGPAATVTARLLAAGCVAAGEESVILLTAAPDPATLEAWVRRRERGEPLAWITGSTTFGGRAVRVTPGVYVPRPQSEELARRAADLLPVEGVAADLCTGSGAIAAHLAAVRPRATIVAVDIDCTAVRAARSNGVAVVLGDLGAPLRGGSLDVVTVVAPYVPTTALGLLPADVRRYEPRHALDGGPDGLRVLRRAVADGARILRPGGWFLCELGAGQDARVEALLDQVGFAPPTAWSDEEGDLRGLVARRR